MLARANLSRAAVIAMTGLTAFALQACGGAASATSTPVGVVVTSAPGASPTAASAAAQPTATTAATAASPTVAVAASPTSAPQPTTAPAAVSTPSTASGGSGGLKPVEPTRPASAVPAAATTPAPGAPAPKQGSVGRSRFLIPSLAQAAPPTPTPVPARKGVANANVDPEQYANEVVADLMLMADAVGQLGELFEQVDAGEIEEQEVVTILQEQSNVLGAVYQRQVARDYPPALKQIDDYYAETTRYASFTADSLLNLFKTGDEKYVAEVEQNIQKFEFFLGELVKLVE